MKRITPLLFLLCGYFYAHTQTFQDCITIDFETILGEASQDGLIISDQFQDTFGLSFLLETGGFPQLAEVGGLATAFSSVYGNDVPAPGQNVGSFFLTDDGGLAGLEAPPIILNFESPVDSFSGCILDMDFGETFIIQARDIDEEIILQDTVLAGDPNTGDGLATCWGFNLEGCEGSVYSIRFEGFRTQTGGFGLGLDNLVFCLSGIDIANVLRFETTPIGCDGSPGSIQIINSSNEEFLYSIDGVNFQSDPVFEDLEIGSYTIYVQDEDGCAAEIDNVEVGLDSYDTPTDINAVNTTCDLNNGVIEIVAEDADGFSYSLDGAYYQSSPIFEFLSEGTYTINIIDDRGCEFNQLAEIGKDILEIDFILEINTNCNEDNGALEVIPSLFNNISYSLDGNNFQESPVFSDLPPGTYNVFIQDDRGCNDSQLATILPSEEVVLEATSEADWCNDENGSITLQASGGSGSYSFSIDDVEAITGLSESSASFIGLAASAYNANVIDDTGCEAQMRVIVPAGESIIASDLSATDPTCEELYGSIVFNSAGGNGDVSYTLNGVNTSITPYFDNLDAGDFTILLIDEKGCQDSLLARLEYPICPIYIPNAFSPEGDWINDFFEVFTNSIYDVDILRFEIFDRWGNHLWENGGFSIHTANFQDWWDGSFRGEMCNSGVFVYMIEVRYVNGFTEILSGDLYLNRQG